MSVMPMGDTVWLHARAKGSAVAIHHEGAARTWLELAAAASRKARALRAMGIGEGDIVSVALPNGIAFFEAAFAVILTGATVHPVSSALPDRELRALLDLARPRLLIGRPASDLPGWQTLPADWEPVGDGGPLASAVAGKWKMMSSGGSTGTPKLIVDPRPALTDPDRHPLSEGDDVLIAAGGVYLSAGPLYHSAPFTFCMPGLFTGAEVVTLTRFDAEKVLRLIEERRVETMFMVPTMMGRIMALPEATRRRYDVSSLRHFLHTAAPCPPALKRQWIEWLGGRHVWEVYGSSESPGIAWLNGDEWLARPGSVGRFKLGTRAKILDEAGGEVPTGTIGEIFMAPPGGVGTTYDYIGADPRRRGGWDSIGDLGYLDADGYLFLADRRADLIIRGGINIYPAEIESVLLEHPDIASCVAIGLPDEDLGERVHAIVEPEAAVGDVDFDRLRSFCRDRLLPYKVPGSWEIVRTPLRNEAGKVRRAALRAERVDAAR